MKYLLSVFAGAVSYGILSTIVVKAYGHGYQLGEVVGAQLLTGFVLSWLLVLYTKFMNKRKAGRQGESKDNPAVLSRLSWKQRGLLILGGAPTAATGLLYYQSLRYNPASLSIVLLFQFTWISVLIQAAISRKRPSNIMLWTLLILFTGTFLAAGLLGQGTEHFNWQGLMFGLLSAVSYSMFILFSGKVVPSAHPVYRSAWMVTGGFILLCILFPPHFLFNGLIWGPLLLFGFLLGLFGAFIPPLLFAVGVPRIGEAMAGILGAVELPVAVLLSTLVLHEHVSGLQWVGVVLILAGVTLPELSKLRGGGKEIMSS